MRKGGNSQGQEHAAEQAEIQRLLRLARQQAESGDDAGASEAAGSAVDIALETMSKTDPVRAGHLASVTGAGGDDSPYVQGAVEHLGDVAAAAEGDVEAFIRVRERLGDPASREELEEFVKRGGPGDIFSDTRTAELLGAGDSPGTVGRWDGFWKDLEAGAGGDAAALERLALQLGKEAVTQADAGELRQTLGGHEGGTGGPGDQPDDMGTGVGTGDGGGDGLGTSPDWTFSSGQDAPGQTNQPGGGAIAGAGIGDVHDEDDVVGDPADWADPFAAMSDPPLVDAADEPGRQSGGGVPAAGSGPADDGQDESGGEAFLVTPTGTGFIEARPGDTTRLEWDDGTVVHFDEDGAIVYVQEGENRTSSSDEDATDETSDDTNADDAEDSTNASSGEDSASGLTAADDVGMGPIEVRPPLLTRHYPTRDPVDAVELGEIVNGDGGVVDPPQDGSADLGAVASAVPHPAIDFGNPDILGYPEELGPLDPSFGTGPVSLGGEDSTWRGFEATAGKPSDSGFSGMANAMEDIESPGMAEGGDGPAG